MTDPATSDETTQQQADDTSALRDNINKKGSNAYYFAHANTATGPVWDGKPEPKLLSTSASSSVSTNGRRQSSFDFKSNITSYAFSDEGATVKLYITMEGVGEKCTDEDITLEHTENSFCFMINNYKEGATEPMCLSFLKLSADISKATYKLKQDRVVLILRKVEKDKKWHTINDKGTPDHEVV